VPKTCLKRRNLLGELQKSDDNLTINLKIFFVIRRFDHASEICKKNYRLQPT